MDRRTLLRGLGAAAAAVAAGDIAVLARRRGAPGPAPPPPAATDRAPPSPGPSPGPPRTPGGAPDDRVARRSATPAGREGDTAPTPTAAAPLAVVCRADWGGAPVAGPLRPHRIARLTVHHTAVVARDGDDGAARVRSHQRHHQGSGFADLAYHFVVGRDGTVYEGRPVGAAGETFTDYDPAGHFLPCLEGDFTRQRPTDVQVARLVELLAWAVATFDVDPATVAGHRRYAATACPGDPVVALIADGTLRGAVEAALASGGVDLRGCTA